MIVAILVMVVVAISAVVVVAVLVVVVLATYSVGGGHGFVSATRFL